MTLLRSICLNLDQNWVENSFLLGSDLYPYSERV